MVITGPLSIPNINLVGNVNYVRYSWAQYVESLSPHIKERNKNDYTVVDPWLRYAHGYSNHRWDIPIHSVTLATDIKGEGKGGGSKLEKKIYCKEPRSRQIERWIEEGIIYNCIILDGIKTNHNQFIKTYINHVIFSIKRSN